ncbi:hypothetical protein [[Clostridium] symbiosum]|uniref:hypothetical protein n=1 Tax=Clostridium symbiosum TaxID=1512 RepID=UPI00064969D3|nr:hypothetical protein [[Clostridium] symbiosum]
MRIIRITLKEGRESIVLDSKGEKQIASLTLLPEKGKTDVEGRKGERGIETCIDCNQTYRQCGK